MDIIENNLNIAEFMDVQVGTYTTEHGLKITYRPDKYWEVLMPVVVKMVTMYHSQCLFEHPGYTNINEKWKFHFEALSDCKCRCDGEGETMLEATYKAVCEFVKWYKKNKGV